MAYEASGAGTAAGRQHPGHPRRDGSPGRPAADERHGLGDLPDRADRLGVRGMHRRDRGENVPVRLAASQGNHPQPVRRAVRPGGGDRHPDRRLRHGLAVGQDRPPPVADLVLGAGRGVHLAVRLRDELPGAGPAVDRQHARDRRVPGHQRRLHERDHGPDGPAPGDDGLPDGLHLPARWSSWAASSRTTGSPASTGSTCGCWPG